MKEIRMWMSFGEEAAEELSAEFSDEDLDLLRLFRAHVDDLRKTKIIKTKWPRKVEYVWKPAVGVTIQTEPIDSEFISSFLHKLRPIILSEEPASYDRISGLIGRRFSNTSMKRHLKAVRSFFETSRFSSYGQITIGDIPIFDQTTLRKWLNAFEYHQDPDKRAQLGLVEREFTREGTRTVFVLQLRERCDGIFLLDDLCRFIIDF